MEFLRPLNALLLFVLSVPIVMKYRILPVDGTPYWLFGLLFFILGVNVFVALYPKIFGKRINADRLGWILLWTALLIVVGGTSITAIVDRSRVAPALGVHDIILQVESAMRFLLSGKNPYLETYFGTPLEAWHYAELGHDAVNPALYHFVMPPWYLLFPFAFYVVSVPFFGFFDARMPLVFLVFATLVLLSRWFKQKNIALLAVTITALSPATFDFFLEGRSDAFALFWLLWSLVLLEKRRWFFSALVFGLALASKQTIWFALPFYYGYLWLQPRKNPGKVLHSIVVTLLTFGIVTLPFIFWDRGAFINSVVLYLNGATANGYPVSGYGLGMLLYGAGVIRDIHAYYPFILWQLALGLPVIGLFAFWLSKKPSMSRLLIGYATTLFVVWYVSRYFNNSHAAYLTSVYAIGILKHIDESAV